MRRLLVQRDLTNTVDGVFGVIDDLGDTVAGTLHHHAAAEDAAEVGALDGVQDAARIHGDHTALLPNEGIGGPFIF